MLGESIGFVAKVADWEEQKSTATVSLDAIQQHEWRCELVFVLRGDVMHHLGNVTDEVKE